MKIARVFLLACALLLLACAADAREPTPGTYAPEGGWGTLTIGAGGAFSLESAGANVHNCSLDGRIVAGRASLPEQCVVEFHAEGEAIRVAPRDTEQNRDACRFYCGMRAIFEGTYFPQPRGCRLEALNRERQAFLREYHAARFPGAAARLEHVLASCGRFLGWMTDAEIRNDLALAQHRAGRESACLATLQPLARLFREDAVYPPVEEEWARDQLPKIRFNWKLCGGTPPPARK